MHDRQGAIQSQFKGWPQGQEGEALQAPLCLRRGLPRSPQSPHALTGMPSAGLSSACRPAQEHRKARKLASGYYLQPIAPRMEHCSHPWETG